MRCDECKFWDVEGGKRECQGKTVGECTRAMPWWDGSGYAAIVLTTADFFCEEFNRK